LINNSRSRDWGLEGGGVGWVKKKVVTNLLFLKKRMNTEFPELEEVGEEGDKNGCFLLVFINFHSPSTLHVSLRVVSS